MLHVALYITTLILVLCQSVIYNFNDLTLCLLLLRYYISCYYNHICCSNNNVVTTGNSVTRDCDIVICYCNVHFVLLHRCPLQYNVTVAMLPMSVLYNVICYHVTCSYCICCCFNVICCYWIFTCCCCFQPQTTGNMTRLHHSLGRGNSDCRKHSQPVVRMDIVE